MANLDAIQADVKLLPWEDIDDVDFWHSRAFRDKSTRALAHRLFQQIWKMHGGHPGAQRIFASVRSCGPKRLNYIIQRDDYANHIDDPVLYFSLYTGLEMYPGGLRDRIRDMKRFDLLEHLDRCVANAHKATLTQRALEEHRDAMAPRLKRMPTATVTVRPDGSIRSQCLQELYDTVVYPREARRIIDETVRPDERALSELIATYFLPLQNI